MKLKDLYKFIIEYGRQKDPRGVKTVDREMARIKKQYQHLSGRGKKEFDLERLVNPYADTRILNGGLETKVKTILVGIDIETGELVLADRLREKGGRIDLVMSHHPEGKAHAGFFKVMYMQADILHKYGVPINVAEGILQQRITEVARKVMPANHNRSVDAARLLGIPFLCVHTPADNGVAVYLQKVLDGKTPETLADIVCIIEEIPEYQYEMEHNIVPAIVVGKESSRAGKIFVDMTGGTSPTDKMFARLSQAGIRTIVGMHCKESGYKVAKTEFVNYVIAGHIASDTLGLNLLFDAVEKKEKLKFIECSGFKRIRRK